jgi:hypothetical protein
MTKYFFVIAVLGLALITFSGIDHATNCEDLLANNIYRCQVIADYGPMSDDCFRFNSATPTVSQISICM